MLIGLISLILTTCDYILLSRMSLHQNIIGSNLNCLACLISLFLRIYPILLSTSDLFVF